MHLRFKTFLSSCRVKLVKEISFFLLLFALCPNFLNAQTTIEDTKKTAKKLYEDDEFTEAYKYYAQLVANFPKDPEFNYRLGVCMLYSEEDKKKCLPYLKQATSAGEDSPKDVYFYLGKAYHINYQFDEAIKNYNEFKRTATPALQKKLQVDKEIAACTNGKRLLSNLSDLQITSKKQLNEVDYFRTYDLKTIGGKLLTKPEEFRTPLDKKKKEKSIVYLPKQSVSSKIFFSSYGENNENGKDIYFVTKTSNGFGPPQKVNGINSEFDEDYPFLHPNGKTLYFSSKGFNSMGGYDIFKSTYDPSNNTWSTPENLQFPINSPDDDYLFVTDSLEQFATFSTGRQSPPGKIDVLKINTERVPIDVLAIKGSVKPETPEQSVASFITIKNIETDVTLGVIGANDKGDYKMELPNGGKILYSVETPGVKTQTAEVILPLTEQSRPFKQEITYEKGRLKIINHFDESNDEDTYLHYMDVIEKKAKLEVTKPKKVSKKPEIVAVVEDTIPKVAQEKNPKIIKQVNDSLVTTTEVKPTETETLAANNNQEPIANNNTEEPQPTDEPEKKEVVKPSVEVKTNSKPPANKTESKQMADVALKDAERSMQEAKQFERDAKSVLETGRGLLAEANRNIEAANGEIVGAFANNDKKAMAMEKKAAAQKDSVAAQNIVIYGTGLQQEALAKREEAEKKQQYAQELINSGNTIDNNSVVSVNDKPAKKPTTKPTKNTKAVKPKTEVAATQKNTATEPEVQNQLPAVSYNDLDDKYSKQLNNNNQSKPEQLKQNNILLSHYNLELDGALKASQAKLKKTKSPEEKQSINEEITALKSQKSQNLELMAKNRELLAQSGEGKTMSQIDATSPAQAVKQMEELKSGLIGSDNENFDFNAYQNVEAQKLKVEADSRINDALARQKKLKVELDKAIEEFLKSDNTASVSKSETELIAEADATREKALKLEAEANRKPAPEKTKLLADAKKLEEKANDTYLLATTQIQNKNQNTLDLNRENISNLVKENKNTETEIAEVQKIEAEANAILQQAQSLRNEANAAGNKTLKLSKNFSAEEKEAEAIQKQKQALEILTKANPDYVLKSSDQKANADTTATEGSLQQKIEALNKSIDEVADIKIESYQKLALANTTEVDSLSEKVSENIEMIDGNPKLKSDMISANNKLKASKKLMVQSEAEKDKAKKLSLLVASVKKQNEAMQQLNGLSSSLNPNAQPLAQTTSTSIAQENLEDTNTETPVATENTNENTTVSNPVNTNTETTTENTNKTTAENQPVTENTNNNTEQPVNNNQVTEENTAQDNQNKAGEPVTNNPVVENNNTQEPTNTNQTTEENTDQNKQNNNSEISTNNAATENTEVATVNVEELVNAPTLRTDTNTNQVINYFNNTNTELSNPAANKMFSASLAQLKQYESELKALENNSGNSQTPVVVDLVKAAEFKGKSEEITREGDDLNIQSIEARKEAKTKEGAEKDTLLAKATQLENQALDKNIEASEYLLQSNEMEVQNNSNMIGAYFAKLKTDNPTLFGELEAKNAELVTARGQIKQIVEEANSMTSKGARFGSLSNAQEREAELMQKQTEILSQLKEQYPDFVYNPEDATAPVSNEPSTETIQKKNQIVAKQQDELTKLSNALRLEFETKKYTVPNKLSPKDEQTRTLVMRLNAESKRYLVQSSQQSDPAIKTKYLSLAAKYAAESLNELSKISSKQPLANNTQPATETPVVSNNETPSEEVNVTPKKVTKPVKKKPVVKKEEPVQTEVFNSVMPDGTETPLENNTAKSVVRVEGLEIKEANAYNENRPIPFDAKIEDGLIFRVQIGAFRNKLPNNTFKGLSPLNAETTTNGYYRYTAGNFNKFELANAVKNDLRSLGYSDAFVVGFYNGKRIPLSEALDILTKEGKMIDRNKMQTAGITLNANVPRAAVNPVIAQNLVDSKAIEKVNGLLYTIQIGVYNKQVTKNQLFNLRPIFSEELPSGLFRYAAGIYNNVDRLLSDKKKVNEYGVKDAFVTAYLNGKRIGFGEAKDKQANDSTVKMETEEPIIFPAANEVNNNVPATVQTTNIGPAFSNNVKEYPAPTPENGVKKSNQGVCFKVQIGAYSKQVPNDVATKYKAIKNWPIESKLITNLYIYSIGNFSAASFAKTLRDQAIGLGIEDAFIVVYKDGKKLYGEEARKYLSQQ